MKSFIAHGEVEHVRLEPVRHRFTYPVTFYGLDLDELPELDAKLPLFGYNRKRPVTISDAGYIDARSEPIKEKFLSLLNGSGMASKIRRVMLVTSPVHFGYIFNPVSFYYGLDEDGGPVCAMAEVNNTFGEKHLYLLTERQDEGSGFPLFYASEKVFHVSPFNKVEGAYRFKLSPLNGSVSMEIQLLKEGRVTMVARLSGVSKPLTARRQVQAILKRPFTPWKTMARIHGEALKLFVRRKLPYNDRPVPQSPMTVGRLKATWFENLCKKAMLKLLPTIKEGELSITLPEGETLCFGSFGHPLRAELTIHDHRFFPRVLMGSDIGLGEGFMDGMWSCSDVTAFLRILVRNMDTATDSDLPLARIAHTLGHLLDRARHNTFAGSLRNIRKHYDLSNDFFSLFLDETFTYSAAIHRSDDGSLEEAQRRKMDHIMALGHIGPEDHVLEIGCGWGGFALEVVRKTGCRLTGITLSKEQHALATQRVTEAGLSDRITILLKDYRKMTGAFSRIVSVEMLEAVGHRYLGTFFEQCDRLLAPNGVAVIQVITVPDQQYDHYRNHEDWIQRYIFPGGHLPSLSALCEAMTKHSKLMVERLENIGPHYAETLRQWRERLFSKRSEMTALGYDEVFQRMWHFYFACCEAQFAERALANLQLVLTRPKTLGIP